MKIGALVRSYYLTDYLPAVLKQFSWVDEIIVANKAFKGVHPVRDDTFDVCKQFMPGNITIHYPLKNTQHEIFNECLGMMQDYDYVFICDADEILFREDQDKLLKRMTAGKNEVVLCKVIDYADSEHIYPVRNSHHVIMLVNPKNVNFYSGRCARSRNSEKFREYNDIIMHHLGFTFNQEKMNWKKSNYWNPGNNKEVHDITSKPKIQYNVPDEIKKLLKT